MPELDRGTEYTSGMVQEAFATDMMPNQDDVLTAMPGMPEMPASHPEFDAKTLTVGGLIKACPYYGKLAETNPELAKTEATEIVQRVQEREAMRESDMDEGAIKKQQWSSMLERHREKTKAEEKASPENATQDHQAEPPRQTTTEQQTAPVGLDPRTHVEQHETAEIKAPPPPEQPSPVLVASHKPTFVAAKQVTHLNGVNADTQTVESRTFATTVNNPTALEALVRAEAAVDPSLHELSVETMDYEQGSLQPLPEIIALTDVPEAEKITDAVFDANPEVVETIEAEEPPSTIFERFVRALQFASEVTENIAPSSVLYAEQNTTVTTEIQFAETVPPIVKEVSELLTRLEPAEQEITLPIVQDISLAVQEVSTLQLAEAEPEKIAEAKEKLTELVFQLFETLGMKRDEEKVQQFVLTLLRPELAKRLVSKKAVGIEGIGTHEIKRRFQEFFAMLAALLTKVPTHRLIGMFAVFHSSPTRLQYVVVA